MFNKWEREQRKLIAYPLSYGFGGKGDKIVALINLIRKEEDTGKDLESKIKKRAKKIKNEYIERLAEYYLNKFNEFYEQKEENLDDPNYKTVLFIPTRMIEYLIKVYKYKEDRNEAKVREYDEKFTEMKKKLSEIGVIYENEIKRSR